jgi:hypothetical protein
LNIKTSNELAKQTIGESKYYEHALAYNPMKEFLNESYGYDIWGMPVCEKCERVAWWDQEHTATCGNCGHHTQKPITVEEFLTGGFHQGLFDKTKYVDRKRADKIATVYGGEAGLPDENKKIYIAQG